MVSLPAISAAAVTKTRQYSCFPWIYCGGLTSENEVGSLEEPAEQRKIASSEDEGDGGSEGDGCGTGVFPL